MKITGMQLNNVRSFKDLPKTNFSESINVFIGENNSGKSTILNAIYLIQKPEILNTVDKTIGSTEANVKLFSKGNHESILNNNDRLGFSFHISSNTRNLLFSSEGEAIYESGWNEYSTPQTEPNNLIYPFLSKRKVEKYSPEVNKTATNAVFSDLRHLTAKIDRLSDPQFTHHEEYIDACDKILGFRISTSGDDETQGKRLVFRLKDFDEILLTKMGEGVPNILGLIADLCVAKNKIFLIEELENDIHPKALKALLNFIIKKSDTNQFFISTHSNIVMRILGSNETSKIFEVSNKSGVDVEQSRLFISEIKEISTPEDRRIALENLGYELLDYDQYEAYLFLEESSAEIIIRDYLIPWYVKTLVGKIRTVSSGGCNNLEKKFSDFNNLFVFMHLEPMYKNKAWVILDNGNNEKSIIDKFKSLYVDKNGWEESNFSQLSKHDFEEYYPEIFREKFISEIKDVKFSSGKDKQKKKEELLEEVKAWIISNEEEAKSQFESTAKEIIDKLKEIETALI